MSLVILSQSRSFSSVIISSSNKESEDLYMMMVLGKLFLGALIGGILGYIYYKKIGCPTGTCPITNNPYRSTIYGAFMGLMLASS